MTQIISRLILQFVYAFDKHLKLNMNIMKSNPGSMKEIIMREKPPIKSGYAKESFTSIHCETPGRLGHSMKEHHSKMSFS